MKVVLLQDVRGQGKNGQIITVSDGYARNFLLPRKLAQEATKDVLNAIEKHDEAVQRRYEEDQTRARLLVKDLEGGSVTAQEIAAALNEQKSIELDHRKLSYDPIKSYGTYPIRVKLFPQIVGTFYLNVTE